MYTDIKQSIIQIGKFLERKRFTIATDGNISVKCSENELLITASGVCKGRMTEEDILLCDLDGRSTADKPVTSEINLHTMIYRQRPDARAVIHAHPEFAITCSMIGISLINPQIPEILMTLGSIPTTEFAAPSSPEGALAIKTLVKSYSAIILDRHGAVTFGTDLQDAWYKMERLEHAARLTYNCYVAGHYKKLNEDDLQAIRDSMQRYKDLHNSFDKNHR